MVDIRELTIPAQDNEHVIDHWQPLAGVVDVGQIVEASDGGSDCNFPVDQCSSPNDKNNGLSASHQRRTGVY